MVPFNLRYQLKIDQLYKISTQNGMRLQQNQSITDRWMNLRQIDLRVTLYFTGAKK